MGCCCEVLLDKLYKLNSEEYSREKIKHPFLHEAFCKCLTEESATGGLLGKASVQEMKDALITHDSN